MLTPSTSTKPRKNSENMSTGCVRPVRHISGRTTHPCVPTGGGRPFLGERDTRMRKAQATDPVRTRSCCVVENEVGGRFTHHTSLGVPARRAATSGDRGVLSGDVSLLWSSGRQHATFAFTSPYRRAVKPTPAVGPCDLPLSEAHVRSPTSEKWCAL